MVSEEKRIEVPLITGAKYRKNFYNAGDKIQILPSEVESLIQDKVIRREDVPEIEDEETPLEEMTLPELKAHAKKNNIDLGDVTKKEEVLAAILKAGDPDGNGGAS